MPSLVPVSHDMAGDRLPTSEWGEWMIERLHEVGYWRTWRRICRVTYHVSSYGSIQRFAYPI